jgi:hypothetical protein
MAKHRTYSIEFKRQLPRNSWLAKRCTGRLSATRSAET